MAPAIPNRLRRRRTIALRAALIFIVVAVCSALGTVAALGGPVHASAAPASASASPSASAPAPKPPASASAGPAPKTSPPRSARAENLEATAHQVRALLAGTLDPSVDPTTLFDVSLDDEPAIELERRRLALEIAALEQTSAGDVTDAGPTEAADAGPGEEVDAGPLPVVLEGDIAADVWAASLDSTGLASRSFD